MAVLDKSKITTLGDVARTGVNPITGEYLSSAQRKTAFRQRSVSAAKVFGKGGALVKTSSNIGSGSNIHGLAERISRLEIQVHTIIKGLNAEEELEKKLQKEQKRDASIENERKDKKNQESLLEKLGENLKSTLLKPVEALGKKAKGILDKIFEFFQIVFVGWLGKQGLDWIKAKTLGFDGQAAKIRNSIIKNLAVAGGIFAAFNFGIGIALRGVFNLTRWLGKKAWRSVFPKSPPKGTLPKGGSILKPSGGKVKVTTGRGSSLARGRGIAPKGNIPGRAPSIPKPLAAAKKGGGILKNITKLLPKGPLVDSISKFASKPLGFLGGMLGGLGKIFTKFMPLLRAGLFANDVRQRAMGDPENKIPGMSPAQSILGALFPLAGSIAGGALGGTIGAAGGPLSIIGLLAGSWAGGWVGDKLQQFLDFLWNPGWDQAPGIKNFNDMVYGLQSKTGGFGDVLQSIFPYSGTSGAASGAASGISSPSGASVSSIASSPTQYSIPSTSGASATSPIIIRKKANSSQQQQLSSSNKSATDVPLIPSSNPDNFYALYSHVKYNVVT